MKYLSKSEQLKRERQKNEALSAENAKLKADVEYLAMMTDIDLYEQPEVQDNE